MKQNQQKSCKNEERYQFRFIVSWTKLKYIRIYISVAFSYELCIVMPRQRELQSDSTISL
jgi:hypothetical protein